MSLPLLLPSLSMARTVTDLKRSCEPHVIGERTVTDCKYHIGDHVKIQITAIGQPDGLIYVDRVSKNYVVKVPFQPTCVQVQLEKDILDKAFISLKSGDVFPSLGLCSGR